MEKICLNWLQILKININLYAWLGWEKKKKQEINKQLDFPVKRILHFRLAAWIAMNYVKLGKYLEYVLN